MVEPKLLNMQEVIEHVKRNSGFGSTILSPTLTAANKMIAIRLVASTETLKIVLDEDAVCLQMQHF